MGSVEASAAAMAQLLAKHPKSSKPTSLARASSHRPATKTGSVSTTPAPLCSTSARHATTPMCDRFPTQAPSSPKPAPSPCRPTWSSAATCPDSGCGWRAWCFLTMNQDGRHDITLIARVAGICAQDGDCPNAQLTSGQQPLATASRTWYKLLDAQMGSQPLPGSVVCPSCVLNIQACCPSIAAASAPVYPAHPREESCVMVPSDWYDDPRSGETLQQLGSCAVAAAVTRRPDVSHFVH